MTLLQPSFRGRLRLFFAVIVIVPLIAVGAVLFQLVDESDSLQLNSRLREAQTGARNLYREAREDANRAAGAIARDRGLARAIESDEQEAVQERVEVLARQVGAQWVTLQVEDFEPVETGSPLAIAAAERQLQSSGAQTIGRITVSTTAARDYATTVKRLLEVETRVDRGNAVLASTLPAAADVRMPNREGADVTIGQKEYRTTLFQAEEPDMSTVTVRVFDEIEQSEDQTYLVIAILIGFLALALLAGVIISRTLSSEIQRLLHAAQRLGRGDFSVTVPAEGNDEFAALGKEFNRMATQLEARLEDLRKERGRLQEAIRRVGESFARGLDRVGVLEIVVQTAVDGVGAAAGRATMRRRADAPMEEVTRQGEPEAYHRALHAAEAAVMDAGEVAEIQIGGASAMAAPLSATEAGDRVLAIVSVARGDRPFAPQERELFAYLTSQAAVSVENVDLHETVQRQAVTDELTGLFNHRRFQEVMSAEVERARRYDAEMGLIMLDIDNFKRVNDTYGHMQGDMVLREVARVLRQSAREIDEPARYGGEEMAVALPQTDLDGAYNFAERVRKRIEALELPLLDGDGILKVTASFGAASLSSAPQSDKEGLVAAADAALYRAKRSGKNRTVKAE
jgi:diguanylate cyclase (GGDEF)-like protein